jgi:hypothetical protein
MKKILTVILLFFIGGCLTPSNHKTDINYLYFSSQERQNFDKGIIVGDFNKIFYACVDVIEGEGYHVTTQRKDDGYIEGGPKTDLNIIYYIKCEIREMTKGVYKLKWTLLKVSRGWGVAEATEETSTDPEFRTAFNQQYNYWVFCTLKNIIYK